MGAVRIKASLKKAGRKQLSYNALMLNTRLVIRTMQSDYDQNMEARFHH